MAELDDAKKAITYLLAEVEQLEAHFMNERFQPFSEYEEIILKAVAENQELYKARTRRRIKW